MLRMEYGWIEHHAYTEEQERCRKIYVCTRVCIFERVRFALIRFSVRASEVAESAIESDTCFIMQY